MGNQQRNRIGAWTFAAIALYAATVSADEFELASESTNGIEVASESSGAEYRIQSGDVLNVSVWHEPDLQTDVVVRPDGSISLPLIGDVVAMGRTIAEVRGDVTARLQKFMPDAAVNVSAKQLLGYKIYVIGKVNRPGEYQLNRDIDVMQALSMAAGTSKFAATERIRILRRDRDGAQAIPFNYDEVEEGIALEQNIVLRAGDVVVVP